MGVERELEIVRQRVLGMIGEVVHDEDVPGSRQAGFPRPQ